MILSFSLAFLKIKIRFLLFLDFLVTYFHFRPPTSGPSGRTGRPVGRPCRCGRLYRLGLFDRLSRPFYSSQLALRGTYASAPSLYSWQLANIPVSPNFNPNCTSSWTGFVSISACALPNLKRTGKAALLRVFSMDSQTLNKINIASVLRLPTSKVFGNYLRKIWA